MFEPDPVESIRLSMQYQECENIRVEAVALGEQTGQSVIKVLRHLGLSSILFLIPCLIGSPKCELVTASRLGSIW